MQMNSIVGYIFREHNHWVIRCTFCITPDHWKRGRLVPMYPRNFVKEGYGHKQTCHDCGKQITQETLHHSDVAGFSGFRKRGVELYPKK